MGSNILENVFSEYLKADKPEQKAAKQKTTLLNIRIPEKIRDDFQMLCYQKSRRTGVKTDMSKEILAYIYDRLENGE